MANFWDSYIKATRPIMSLIAGPLGDVLPAFVPQKRGFANLSEADISSCSAYKRNILDPNFKLEMYHKTAKSQQEQTTASHG